MLPLEALRSVTHVVTHAGCADGAAAAMITKAAIPNADVRAFYYDDPEYLNLPATPGMLFVDITPPRHRLGEFIAEAAIVLDHHDRSLVSPFGDLGVFGNNADGESGAILAYCDVYERLVDHDSCAAALAYLSGIYDTWQTTSPRWEEACHLAALLQTMPLSWCLPRKFADVLIDAQIFGPHLHAEKVAESAKVAAGAHRMLVGDRRVAVVPTTQVNFIDVPDADIIAGFRYQSGAPRIKWSLRSRTIDVGAIARRNGGNGHAASAGFHTPDDGRSPYARIAELLGA